MWRRGDLMFWPGHVAFVRDADTIIHANGKDMAVAVETIDSVLARTAAAGEPLRRVAVFSAAPGKVRRGFPFGTAPSLQSLARSATAAISGIAMATPRKRTKWCVAT